MLAELNANLARVSEQVSRAERLQRRLAQLEAEQAAAAADADRLQRVAVREERDVDRLEGLSLAGLFALAQEEQRLQGQLRQLQEAVAAGEQAAGALGRVQDALRSARGWGTWDLLGGGVIATAVKHSRMDDARQEAHLAQQALAAFRRCWTRRPPSCPGCRPNWTRSAPGGPGWWPTRAEPGARPGIARPPSARTGADGGSVG